MKCWYKDCLIRPSYFVAEVWFEDEGKRLFGTRDVTWGPPPAMCLLHKKSKANTLAEAVLLQAYRNGLIPSGWPTQWSVSYADGHVITGPVLPKPDNLKQEKPAQGSEYKLWCQKHWKEIVLPEVDKYGAIAVTIDLFQAVATDPAFVEFRSHFGTNEHEKALIAFLNQHGPACCYLGADRVRQILHNPSHKEKK